MGGLVGGAIDPEVIRGPALGDIPVQTSQEGVPRPIVFGSPPPFPGNIIQTGPKVFTTKRERQGKGGPVVESQEVYQAYLIRICQGPATVITVWRDGKVVFDRSGKFPIDADGQAFAARVRFYEGDEEQLPDAGFEALVGSGNQPAYRGTAYMAVYMDNLTQTGGRIPNYEFRMASVAEVTDDCGLEEGLFFWYPLNDAAPGGRAAEVINGFDGRYSDDFIAGGQALSIDGRGSAEFRAGGYMRVDEGVLPGMGAFDDWSVTVWFQPLPGESGVNEGGASDKEIALMDSGAFGVGSPSHHWKFTLDNPSTPALEKNRYPFMSVTYSGSSTSNIQSTELVTNFHTYFMALTYTRNPLPATDGTLRGYLNGSLVTTNLNIERHTSVSDFTLLLGGGGGAAGYGPGVYAPLHQFLGLIADLKGYNYALSGQEISDRYRSTDDDYWENPDAPGTYTDAYGNIYSSCVSSADIGTTSLADVELEIARMVGIAPAQFNVSSDTAVAVDGLVIGKQMRAADALSVLGQAYLRDYPEYDLQIVSTPRGGVSVATLTEENCLDTGTDEETRAQPIDLPRSINVYFYDQDAAAVVPVNAKRTSINVTAEGTIPMQLPMTLNRDHAKQIAEITMKTMWEEQTGSRLIRDLPLYEHAYLTPADPIEFEGKRWRIQKTTMREGALQIEAVRDRISNYSSAATANILEPPQTPVPNIKGPSVFVAMNLPALRTEDAGRSGVYGAVTGLTTGWPGCDIYVTLDEDANTWTRLIRMQSAATMGRLYSDLSSAVDSNGLLIDTLEVKIYNNAELDSATQAQIDAGANAFAINTAGVSDIGQFGTALPDSGGIFALTDVVLGQLTTTAADHDERDTFVKLDTNLYFIDLPAEWAGETVYFRAVTIGTPLENATTFSLVFESPTLIIDGGEVT